MGNYREPQSANEAALQNILGEQNELREPQSPVEFYLQEIIEQSGGKSDVTVLAPLSIDYQEEESFLVDDVLFRKISNVVFSEQQLLNIIISVDGGGQIPITSEMLVDMADDPDNPIDGIAVVAEELTFLIAVSSTAKGGVPSVGLYTPNFLALEFVEGNIVLLTPTTVTAKYRSIAYGEAEMESGVSDLPEGVIYFQLEEPISETEGE